MARLPLLSRFLCFLLCCGWVVCDQCPDGEPVSHFDIDDEDNPSVYDDLTTTEIKLVYDYMKSRPEFDVKEGNMVTMNSTYVYFIERLDPVKSEVLAYLDGTGSKPLRFARVIMYRGDQTPPVIEEYKVGPLPTINSHTTITIGGQQSVDYIARHLFSPADYAAWTRVAERELEKVEDYLQDVTGYKFKGCTDKCLTYLPGMPGQFKSKDRSMWIFMLRVLEGYYLHPIGLQFRVDAGPSLDTDTWTVNFVWFRGQTYKNFDEMAQNVVPPTKRDPPIDGTSKNLYSSLNHRGDPLPEKAQRGPRSFMPDGRRYTVDGHHITWQGWAFDFNLRSLIGLQVHDVRFRKERIAYELSLSEIAIVYSGSSPSPMHSAFIDGPFYFGLETFELVPGVDCPEHATFFDFAHFFNFNPIIFKKSACVFELDRGLPLRRHYESDHAGGYYFIQGMPGNVLVLRSAITVYNYEYILDYVFHQNGAVEVVTSLSGYILSAYNAGAPGGSNRGFEVFPNGAGGIHNHLIHFKVDMDVGQTQNRFESLDIEIENVEDPANTSERINVQKFTRTLHGYEKNATYKFNIDTPKYLLFTNDKAENKFGNKKSYRLLPVSVNKQLLPENWAVEKGMSWARYQVAVTKRKETEGRASSLYNLLDNVDPVVNFQDFIDDNETIIDEDLVAWVSVGTFHIPHSEDIPIVQTPGVSLTFYLLPYNYFDEDPSLASRDNIRVTPKKDGSANYEYVGVSPDVTCYLKQQTCTSGTSPFRVFTAIVIVSWLSICFV